ncbi:MAG: thiamine diphosphokinase [Bacteroidetes bacterium]|nr:thiamine diphosphokinase [Bacteroidota bacterium]
MDTSRNDRIALLLCNGEMADRRVVHALERQADMVVCADGGANAARDLEIVPHVVIGDFDSITADTRAFFERAGVSMMHLPRQNDTDFEKALILLRMQGVKTVAVCGVTGKLLDHTLGNFSILLRYADAFRIVMFDPHYRIDLISAGIDQATAGIDRATAGIDQATAGIDRATVPARFSSRPGDRISIVPLSTARGVRYRGLKFPFEGATLAFGVAEGTCNEALGEEFEVGVTDGVLLVFRELHEGMWLL